MALFLWPVVGLITTCLSGVTLRVTPPRRWMTKYPDHRFALKYGADGGLRGL